MSCSHLPLQHLLLQLLFPPVAEATRDPPKQNHPQLDRPDTQSQEPIPCLTPDTEVKQETQPQEIAEAPSNLPVAIGRPRRATRKPDRYGHNICERIENKMRHLQPGICLERQVEHLADTNAMEKPKQLIANQLYPEGETKNNDY